MNAPLRFLLDQGFPQPPYGLVFEKLDRTVTLEHFSRVFPEHADVSTPDWKMYLLGAEGGFDAVVTIDVSQVEQDTEMVALERSKIGLVTWDSGKSDPIILYGQLLAYMGAIVKQLRERRSTVILLPKATLRPANVYRPSDITRRRDRRDRSNWPQRVGSAVKFMLTELEGTLDADLSSHLRGP